METSTTLVRRGDSGQRLRRAAHRKRLMVMDYDGTLAYLAIDWPSVRRDLSKAAAQVGFNSSFRPLWDQIGEFRDERGAARLPHLFRVLARHEEIGVDGQQPRWEILSQVRSVLVEEAMDAAIFSSNLHQTVQAGLRKLGLESISAIVGADDVAHWKPDPEGLDVLLQRAGVSPSAAVFVGDSQRDADAAGTAGVEFVWV